MPETRIKARRYRILQLSSYDCITEDERKLFDDYKACTNVDEKKELRLKFDSKVAEFEGIRSIPDSKLYKRNDDGTLSNEYKEGIQNPMFEGEMARIANDFSTTFPLVKEIVYFNCALRPVLKQVIDNNLLIGGEKYIFYSATTNQMKKEIIILLRESFFIGNESRIMCGLSRDIINKGNSRVQGCNIGKYLAYTSLPMSASVEVPAININEEQYEINIDDCIVVPDFEGKVIETVNYLDVETLKAEIKEMPVDVPFMDGAGIFLPDAGVLPRTGQIRGGYFKGCLFPFDFVKFLQSRGDSTSIITDIYGDGIDIIKQGIKVIFTGSQFKMWKYYDNWEEYKRIFKECGCKIVLNNLAHTPNKNSEVRLTYQFLQTIRRDRFTDEAIKKLCENTVKSLKGAKQDIKIALRIMGITDDENKVYKPLQAALKLYPALINDKAIESMIRENVNSKRKDAMGGKISVDGLYTYICPDLYAFCEHLFCGISEPKGLIPKGMVYNSYYNDSDIVEVDCLRSPHLGDSEHCIRKLNKSRECQEWFNGYDLIVSNHDLISKHLMCDFDGDEALVTSSKELISLVERDKPALYYEMAKAEARQITNDGLYDCLIASFDNSIIGDISNVITKLYSVDGDPDYEFIRILTAYNNYTIDFPKSQKPMDLKQYEEIYQEWANRKRHKLPQYFRYSKNKSERTVSESTNCNVDRICNYISNAVPRGKYLIFSDKKEDEINPEIFKNQSIDVIRTSRKYEKLVKLLERFHYQAADSQKRAKQIKNKLTENKSFDELGLKTDFYYFLCRQDILQIFNGSEHKAASYLVDAEYYQPQLKSYSKKIIWNCFGGVVVENIKNNLSVDSPLKVRREQYIIKGTDLYDRIMNAVEETDESTSEIRITNITDKEYSWIESQNYRKNCAADRLLLFILLYLQKRYSRNEYFKIHTKVKKDGITPNTIDKWIGSDVCKKGLSRLEVKSLIEMEDVINQYGRYFKIHVNVPEFEIENVLFEIAGGNPLIPLYKYTGECVVKKCVECGREFVAEGNLKTCESALCKKKLTKNTKDRCNKNVILNLEDLQKNKQLKKPYISTNLRCLYQTADI